MIASSIKSAACGNLTRKDFSVIPAAAASLVGLVMFIRGGIFGAVNDDVGDDGLMLYRYVAARTVAVPAMNCEVCG